MKLIRFRDPDGKIAWGEQLSDGSARVLTSGIYQPWTFSDEVRSVAALLAPIEPTNIFGIGRNYAAHITETGADRPERPLVFMKPTTAVLDPDSAIEIPTSAPDWVDFEAELAVVIGKRARNVAVDDALDYVLGYTVANDVTARDCQKHDKQWPRAKGFDTFCPLGPCLVPSAELDPNDLTVSSTLDGRQMQSASTAAMIFSTAELISYLSHQFTLLPGTLILTGTPEGVGYVRQPPSLLKPGSEIVVSVGGIGDLRNSVRSATT
jgi:2-keto-4-pentenoate hydratase/2-oxohepta-3-ene-1,7-dioic acid hydratase in catechol pathway